MDYRGQIVKYTVFYSWQSDSARLLPFFHRYAGGAKAESKVSWNGRESFEKAAPYPWFAKTQRSSCVSGGYNPEFVATLFTESTYTR